MKQYLDLVKRVFDTGIRVPDRTGAGRIRSFGHRLEFDLNDGFPLVTARQIFTKPLIHELLWFIRGSTDVKELHEVGVRIWDKWTINDSNIQAETAKVGEFYFKHFPEDSDEVKRQTIKDIETSVSMKRDNIGPMYGYLWRNAPNFNKGSIPEHCELSYEELPSDKKKLYLKEWRQMYPEFCEETDAGIEQNEAYRRFCDGEYYQTVDQLNNVFQGLKKNPYSARHVVTAWVPELVPHEVATPQENILHGFGALAPCHAMFQFFMEPYYDEATGESGNRLNLQMYQRSVDLLVGSPYNIAQYSLLLSIFAHCLRVKVGRFIYPTGDTHIYANQIVSDQGEPLLEKLLEREPCPLPTLWLNPEVRDPFAFTFDDIKILNYNPWPRIDFPVNE